MKCEKHKTIPEEGSCIHCLFEAYEQLTIRTEKAEIERDNLAAELKEMKARCENLHEFMQHELDKRIDGFRCSHATGACDEECDLVAGLSKDLNEARRVAFEIAYEHNRILDHLVVMDKCHRSPWSTLELALSWREKGES